MMMKLNLDSSDRTPHEFDSCLLNETFNPEFDESDNEPF